MKIEYTPECGQGFVRPGETEKQQNWSFSGIKKAAPKWSRLSEQITRCAVCVCDPKHKHGDDSRYQAGVQCNQSGSVRCHNCEALSFDEYSLRYFSRAKEHGANRSDSCSFFLRRLFRAGDVFSVDSSLVIVCACKAMRRSSSHHGADSDYSDSLALRRWRRLISPCIDAMMNCDVLSPDSFTNSMSFTISCGTRAFRACDFAFVVPVAISIPLLDWWGTVYTEKAQIKLLTWAAPKEYSGPHLEVIKVHKCKAPQVSLPLAGLLTTNDSNSIEVAMLNHTTHPQGRDSHNLNKYIWRFIALSTAQPRVITIEASSEQEARQQSPAGCVMVFAARIRQGVCHD
ncbi:TPA: host cell division inhibitor Icd-like protein [Escherichia coli]|nr:host cell division inhibitor Icd-like protein [Escherichia coli]